MENGGTGGGGSGGLSVQADGGAARPRTGSPGLSGGGGGSGAAPLTNGAKFASTESLQIGASAADGESEPQQPQVRGILLCVEIFFIIFTIGYFTPKRGTV